MKPIKKLYITFLSAVLLLAAGCQDILEEEPRANLTPDLFETAQGLEGGITAAYSYLRYFYGTEGGMNLTVYGTDEFTNGNQTTDPPLNTYVALTSGNGDLLTPWNRAYPAINTVNGVIELAPTTVGLSDTEKQNIIAEAKFIRAQWYFMLVQTFGGVTLDLGSGPLQFNRTAANSFKRESLATTYEAIINDLEEAAVELPDAPRDPGRAWKATALHVLAKAYLSRGWSEAAESDDFQNALLTAQKLIPDATSPVGNYGTALLDDFAAVFEEGNEYSEEILLTANRSGDVNTNVIDTNTGINDTNLMQNRSNFFFRPFYTDYVGMIRDVENGRPWIRYRPTEWLLYEAFNNKTIDSRYKKSFQTVWIANNPDLSVYPVWSADDEAAGYGIAGEPKFTLGDTAVWMVPPYIAEDLTPEEIAAKGYNVVLPSELTTGRYPSLSKYDATARPNSAYATDANVASYRPYIIYRLAETYLIAAEAALKTSNNTALAADYINTVRRRAAWPGQETAIEITAGDVDLDFILDERSRELAGESMRWWDLARTKTLEARVEAYNPNVTDVEPYHYLRPIPQSYLDLVVGEYPQNPGY